MADILFGSAGTTATEIDLSFPTPAAPIGVPAGVIGTADEGPAFVPITVASYPNFAAVFGDSDGEKFGPLAVDAYLKSAQSLSYIRLLGIGNGKRRSTTTGKVTNAGFVAGAEIVQDNGTVARNKYGSSDGNSLGRTYFLGCWMSQSAGSTVFSEAGLQETKATALGSPPAVPIIRGVLLAASGVTLSLSGNFIAQGSAAPSNTTEYRSGDANIQGGMTGSVHLSSQEFVMLLNGHSTAIAGSGKNVITASFDMKKDGYFGNQFNTDPTALERTGHLLYARYDIHPALAVVTGTGVLSNTVDFSKTGNPTKWNECAFLASGSDSRNSSSTTQPNYESFEDRFTSPSAPFMISQDFGGTKYDLFRIHAIADGEYSNTRFKVSIENIKPRSSATNKFGTFDIVVRKFSDSDYEKVILESYRGINLDPSSDKYVARAIGDKKVYFDFDQSPAAQKIVVDGDHPVMSNFIRVEMSTAMKAGQVPKTALPIGHRGYNHLVTSGSGPIQTTGTAQFNTAITNNPIKHIVEMPIPYRRNVAVGQAPNKSAKAIFYWGANLTVSDHPITEPNQDGLLDQSFFSYAKYFPNFAPSSLNVSVGNNPGKADSGGVIFDCDRFNNNIFTLERLQVRTGSTVEGGVNIADTKEWASASYVRNGQISANETLKTRAFKVDDLKSSGNRRFAKFTFFLQGGFDGSNTFDRDKARFLNAAIKREMDDATSQGGTSGPTVAAYRKALDIMGTKSDVDIKLLAVPGARHSAVTDYAIDTVENRFDAMYVMDIEERDEVNTVVTSSVQIPSVGNTVTSFKNRGLNSSFAAAYFPDMVVRDPTTSTNVKVPPSVSVLGALSLNDSIGYPWFAPAGYSRGALDDVILSTLPLNKANLDEIYDASINPITKFPGTGMMVWGQKTLLAEASALDRVNVRRLLINIRRSVRNIARLMLFEPNRQETLDKFNALVTPILQSIQEKSGVDRYKVIIDATTTTQADVENNTLRGKIFIQPTRTAEFVSLDFVVTNAGNFFGA